MKLNLIAWIVGLILLPTNTIAQNKIVSRLTIQPTQLVTHDNPALQQVDLVIESAKDLEKCSLQVFNGKKRINADVSFDLKKGISNVSVFLPEPTQTIQSTWILTKGSKTIIKKDFKWEVPRHWTIYLVKSTHIDIGLHNPQYKQRLETTELIDEAIKLADLGKTRPGASKYRYIVEGMWWWLNYVKERDKHSVDKVINEYVKKGYLGIGASHSGNHTQVFGEEEMCRSAYYTKQLKDRWDVNTGFMIFADNNGISWPLVSTYADAGIKYMGYFPNSWNPPTVGESRIGVEYDSGLPHLFYWRSHDRKDSILVWTAPSYVWASFYFGIQTCIARPPFFVEPDTIAPRLVKQLANLEARYPYDVWLVSNYDDNDYETTNLVSSNVVHAWNKKWQWPQLRTVGDMSEPFRIVEERFGDKIPTLEGTMTGGWAQHPLSTPALLAKKKEAARLLPVAEKLSTIAYLTNRNYLYPKVAYERAWDALICNDEHGYGVSSYKGRSVFDTWMQKKDWIDFGLETGKQESKRALKAIASQIGATHPAIMVFNPLLQKRSEIVEIELPGSYSDINAVVDPDGNLIKALRNGNTIRFVAPDIPPVGYTVYYLSNDDKQQTVEQRNNNTPPVLENRYYRLVFNEKGSIVTIFDKELGMELLDQSSIYNANQFIYTNNAHKSFSRLTSAGFIIEKSFIDQTVVAHLKDELSGAKIIQRVTLPFNEKRIDIDNTLDQVRGLAEENRWNRFGYYAFPFNVENPQFRIELNGCDVDPFKDQTGHGTDAYHAANNWSHVGNNEFGITLVQHDSHLIELGQIHKMKNTIDKKAASSHLYSYIFNDWLYSHAHASGPSDMNLHYRYTIYSHAGDYKEANIATFADRVVNPVLAGLIPSAQKGYLPLSRNFVSSDKDNIRLLALKLTDDPGQGIIARFHETKGENSNANFNFGWGDNLLFTLCSITEKDRAKLKNAGFSIAPYGYSTLRIQQQSSLLQPPVIEINNISDNSLTLEWKKVEGARYYNIYRAEYADFISNEYSFLTSANNVSINDEYVTQGITYHYRVAAVDTKGRQGHLSSVVSAAALAEGKSAPAKVGSFYTGLISKPRAWRADEDNILYLQWGQNKEKDISHYELYRSTNPDFEPNKNAFLRKVQPGAYAAVIAEDNGLLPYTTYYYRVLAVDNDGNKGECSDVFSGTTRELIIK
ncbi:MAG: hypothetical protein LBS07_06550 [Prevotellaceae bacterium]|jgi:hypothetical protein|nr:hypothetical protein [Prevotellaceae bacterium]